MDLTLQHLRLLREVARRSTITAAAEALGYTRSAVSQQLMGLERSTGVAVLERVGRGVRLTDAGRELVRHADDVLSGMEAARSALESEAVTVRGTLDLGVYESITAPFLAPLVTSLAIDHPELHVRSREIDPEDAVDAVALGDLDLAFTLDYPHRPASRRDDIVRTFVAEDAFVVVVAADDPLQGPVVELSALAGRPIIGPSPNLGCGRAIVLACRDAGFELDLVHQIDGYPAAIGLAAAGLGVALVPSRSVAADAPVRTLVLEPPLRRVVEVAHRTSSSARPMIVAAVERLRRLGSAPWPEH